MPGMASKTHSVTVIAAVALAVNRFVAHGGGYATSSNDVLGVSEIAAPEGRACSCVTHYSWPVVAAETIAAGDWIKPAGDGTGRAAVGSATDACGRAIGAANAGQLVDVRLMLQFGVRGDTGTGPEGPAGPAGASGQSLARAPSGGLLFALKTDSNPSVSPTAQVVAGVYPGMIVESLYCMAAGSGALTLHDSSNGALNAAERVFRIAAPAANTLYPLPTPHQVRSLLMGGQSTMGSWWVVARPAGDGDVPRYNNSFVVGVDAAGIVSPGPVYLDSIEVVAAGSANSLVLYEGTDTTFRQIHSIAFGSLAALSPIRLGVGPVRLNGLRAAVPTGGQFNFRLFPI